MFGLPVEKSTANFAAVYILLFENLICPFPKNLASHNSMQKKDYKVGNKIAYKEERQRKKRERERKMEIDSQKKSKTKPSPNFGFR